MWRLLPYLQWLWLAVVSALALGVSTNLLFGPLRLGVRNFLESHWPLISLVLLTIGAVTLSSWRAKRRREQQKETQERWNERERKRQEQVEQQQQLHQYFALFKPTLELSPEDLGFQVLRQGVVPDPRYRPHYQVYIPRRAVLYGHISQKGHQRIYNEDDLVQILQQGIGFVLLGQPLYGKTRTLFEIVRRLPGYYVVRPADHPTPPDEAFSILKGRRVVLLLEDLNSYARGLPDLIEFRGKINQYSETWTVIATCRDGPELGAVKNAIGTSLSRFYQDIPLELSLLPLTAEEKEQLARGIGRALNPQEHEFFPTPGSITMEEPLGIMRKRFDSLTPEPKDTLRGLKLLATAGILPFTYRRVQGILEHIFKRTLHLGDSLDILADQALIHRPARQDPIQPEPAYLQGVVTYLEGRKPEDEFSTLVNVLEEIADVEGLFYLGNTYLENLKENQSALDAYERALKLDLGDSRVWHNKGIALARLGRYPDALEAYEVSLFLHPNVPEAWHNKGIALDRLGRYPDALEAFDRALQHHPDDPKTWHGKAVILERLGRYQEALQASEQALLLRPDLPEAWHSKGIALNRLGRYPDALEAFDRALQHHPDDPDVWHSKGVVLARLGRYPDALEAFDRALQHHPDDPDVWHNKGATLIDVGRYQEALQASEQALLLRPDLPEAWHSKGIVLHGLGQYQEALQASEQALLLRSDLLEAWHTKAAALDRLGRYPDALEAFDRALQHHPDDPKTWHGKAVILAKLGRSQEAVDALAKALNALDRAFQRHLNDIEA